MTPLQDLLPARAHDLRCSDCVYGIAPRPDPPPCPMCGGDDWEPLRVPRTALEPVAA